jgi:hypothetical protein
MSNELICRSANGRASVRRIEIDPMAVPAWIKGTGSSAVKKTSSELAALRVFVCFGLQIEDLDSLSVEDGASVESSTH